MRSRTVRSFLHQLSSRKMALQPSLSPLIVAGNPSAPHTLDIFGISNLSSVFMFHGSLIFDTGCMHLCYKCSGLCLSVQVWLPTMPIFQRTDVFWSAKLSFTINNVVKPLLDAGGKYDGKVKAILRLQVQPWHSSSTLTHEAALAVGLAAGSYRRTESWTQPLSHVGCPSSTR